MEEKGFTKQELLKYIEKVSHYRTMIETKDIKSV